jgi:hypothetical protein
MRRRTIRRSATLRWRPLGSMVLHAFRRREERVVMQRHGVSHHCMAAA